MQQYSIFTSADPTSQILLGSVTINGVSPPTPPLLLCAPLPEEQLLIAKGSTLALLFDHPGASTSSLFSNGAQTTLKFPYTPTQSVVCPVQLEVITTATGLLVMATVQAHTLTLPLVVPVPQGGPMTASLPTDGSQHPAIGIYVPGVGVIAAGGVSVQTDTNGVQYAILNANASLSAASLAINDATTTSHTLTVDASGKIGVSSLPAVSGTVTANAGTNLNTSTLAIETGGNLATVATNTGNIPAKGQATMTASMPVVMASNQSPIPVLAGGAADTTASGTVTNDNDTVSIVCPGGQSTWVVEITGTWAGTLLFEASTDSTATWNATSGHLMGSATIATSATSNGVWRGNAAGLTNFHVKLHPATSGTATIAIRLSTGVYATSITNTVPENLTQVGGSAITLGQTTMAGSLPVVLPSNQGSIPVNLQLSGTAVKDDTAFGDGITSGTASVVGRLYNGSSYDRPRGDNTGAARVSLYGKNSVAGDTPVLLDASGRPLVNVAQINGVAPTMGNGVSGTGVQRVTIASDSTGQVALAAGTATIGALTANQSTNINQWAGATPGVSNPVYASLSLSTATAAYGSNPANLAASSADTIFKWGGSGTTTVNHVVIQNNSAVGIFYAFDQSSTVAGNAIYVLAAGQIAFWDRAVTALHFSSSATTAFGGQTGIAVEGFV